MCEDIKDKLRELREVCLEAGEVRKDSSLSPPPASCCPHFWKKTGTNQHKGKRAIKQKTIVDPKYLSCFFSACVEAGLVLLLLIFNSTVDLRVHLSLTALLLHSFYLLDAVAVTMLNIGFCCLCLLNSRSYSSLLGSSILPQSCFPSHYGQCTSSKSKYHLNPACIHSGGFSLPLGSTWITSHGTT